MGAPFSIALIIMLSIKNDNWLLELKKTFSKEQLNNWCTK